MYGVEEEHDREIDLISLPKKSFWKLSIPIAIFLLFETFYSVVDMMWLVNYSKDAAVAVSTCAPILLLVTTFGDSLGQGTNSIMSRFIGSGNYEGAYNSIVHGLLYSLILSILIILSLPYMGGLIDWFSLDTNNLIYEYILPILSCSFLILLTNLFSETLQAEGDSKTPVKIIIGSSIINLILDPIFIFALDLGVQGAALASISASLICVITLLYLYLRGRTKVPLSLKYFKFSPHISFEIFKVAVPNFIDDSIYCFISLFINGTLIVAIGSIGVLLYTVSLEIKHLLLAPIKGMGRGLMSVVGHLFGAKKIDELYEMYIYVLKVSILAVLLISLAFFVLKDLIYSSFQIVDMETSIFSIAVCGIAILMSYPLYNISGKMLNGFGKSYIYLVMNIMKSIFIVVLLIFLDDIIGGGASVLISITLGDVIFAIIYFITLRLLIWKFKRQKDDLVVT